ncbi:MAG TPA: iron-containing alcohol dehydrogenase [Xanthobacteraceae bacterium]|nr:iron-containing alcohol dehydrogenase [Xanthobacteraceae bacterium]
MHLRGNWNFPTNVRFGAGRIAELPEAVRAAGFSKPLFVTDPNLANAAMVADAVANLRASGMPAQLFSAVRPNPVEANILDGVAAFGRGAHDGVVAFGGGSVLDVGKLIAFMHGQKRPIWDFEDVGDWWTRADARAIAPVVAIPTTAGTGSEVGRAAVVTDEARRSKKVIFHPQMLPKFVICDPALTAGMPPHITAGTGMDALAHCLEAYCVPSYHPLADGIAVEGIRLANQHLARAYRNGTDLDARAHMMAAAAMGATAFQKGLGAIHALSHPIGALHDTHHGLTNAVLMPYVLAFNRPAIEERLARLAAYLGLSASFTAFLDRVLALRAEIGVPQTLRELGVDETYAKQIIRMAPEDPTAAGNPIPLDAAAAQRIFDAALHGRL